MGLFGLGEKNYATIVAPLKKMAADLAQYISEQETKIEDIDSQINVLNDEKSVSQSEIAKSNFTTSKINDLIASDLDENGIADVDELPETDDSEEPPVE